MPMAIQSGADLYLRCPYQAKVMKMLEMVSSRAVSILSPGRARDLPRGTLRDGESLVVRTHPGQITSGEHIAPVKRPVQRGFLVL